MTRKQNTKTESTETNVVEQDRIENLSKIVINLTERVKLLEEKLASRDGPKSERAMTDDDARRILPFGDLEGASHKEAAEKLNLSYGQIYSCRKGFTFKSIHKEIEMKTLAEAGRINEDQ